MECSELRARARASLMGRWKTAVVATLLAAVLGGLLAGTGFSINININEDVLRRLPDVVKAYVTICASIGGALGLAQFIIGGVVELGYSKFLLKQHDGEEAEVYDIFSQFHRFGDGFCQSLLRGLYIFLWSLLFIIPGIVAAFKYAMTPFIMVENPQLSASEAITASKELMDGHKAELFVLGLSFIGWAILSALTLGIGNLWLNPYINATYAVFYRSLCPKNACIEAETE